MRTVRALVVVGALCAACGLGITGLGGTSGTGDDGGADGAADVQADGRLADTGHAMNDVASDGSDGGSGGDAGADADAATSPCLLGKPGPIMVPVGDAGYCIDSTEVTNSQYIAFLTAVDGGPPPGQPDYCSWNSSNYPDQNLWSPDAGGALPVWGVDWCDAYAYCGWAGKRLCGHIGSGHNDPGALNDATKSQWFRACSANNTLPYPYGPTYIPGTCWDGQMLDGQHPPVPVTMFAGCVGGYPGLHDMSGNVKELEDSCDHYSPTMGDKDNCQLRGGGVWDDMGHVACNANTAAQRDVVAQDIGFRCCAP